MESHLTLADITLLTVARELVLMKNNVYLENKGMRIFAKSLLYVLSEFLATAFIKFYVNSWA